MPRRILIFACLWVALLVVALYVANHPRRLTVMTSAEKQDQYGQAYQVTVKRLKDYYRGGRSKLRPDRFHIELQQGGEFAVSSYEFEGSVSITNAVIKWPELNAFVVTFDKSFAVTCTWDEDKAVWERK